MTFNDLVNFEDTLSNVDNTWEGCLVDLPLNPEIYSSSDNSFVPIPSLRPTMYDIIEGTKHIIYKDIMESSMPSLSFTIYKKIPATLVKSTKRVVSFCTRKMGSRRYLITKGFLASSTQAYDMNGTVSTIPITHVLMCLAVKSTRVSKILKGAYTPEDFVLLVSTEFSSEPSHKSMYSKVNKEYIKPLQEAGVGIMVVPKIEGFILSNLELDKPRKLTDLVKYLDKFNDVVLDYNSKPEIQEEKEDGKEISKTKPLSESELQTVLEEILSEDSSTTISEPEPGDYF